MAKKILILSSCPSGQGGVATVVGVYKEFIDRETCPLEFLVTHKQGGRLVKILVFMRALFAFIGHMLRGDIAVVHAHTSLRASFFRKSMFFILAFIFRVKVILHLHSGAFMVFYHQECGSLLKKYVRWIFKKADKVVVLSSQWKENISEICTGKKVVVIFNPIRAADSVNAAAQNSQTLLFLGKLAEKKGIYCLLDAIVPLKERYQNIRLLCGGEGELENVEAYSRQLGIKDNVQLLGWVSGSEKDLYLQQSTIYVLPSFSEGLPMGVLEAMAAGLPVVSTPVGGIPDAVEDGVEGFLVEPGDSQALAEAIRRLLDDAKLRAEMGAAGQRKVAECFLPEKVIPEILSVYRELGVSC